MRSLRFSLILFSLLLLSCARSKPPQFYVLNPLPSMKAVRLSHSALRIGIDEIKTPSYFSKDFLIHCNPHYLRLAENNQWVEALDKNISRVIETNLSTLIPDAIVKTAPWDSLFKPNYHLYITISEFTVDVHGESILRAEVLLYHGEEFMKKTKYFFHQKAPMACTEEMVISMNKNLTCLTEAIAHAFRH